MKIHQIHMSKPVRKFGFNRLYKLDEYSDERKPLVVFGLYRERDLKIVQNHKSDVYLIWAGVDTLKAPLHKLHDSKITHIAGIPAMVTFLRSHGLNTFRLRMPAKEKPKPTVKGEQVYAYLQKGKPLYHGEKAVDEVRAIIKDRFFIGTHAVKRRRWEAGVRGHVYKRAFVGLFLSEYAGGAFGSIEMGIRGIRVVSNVLDLPHCLPWSSVDDIVSHISDERETIGQVDSELAEQVYESLDRDIECFDTEKSLIHEA